MNLSWIAVVLAAVGCGSADEPPPAAEPAAAPPAEKPAGRVISVGNEPEGIVVDTETGRVAVGMRNPDSLLILAARDGRVLRRRPLAESPRHLALAGPGGPVLVPAERSNELLEVPLARGAIRSHAVGEFPHDAAPVAGRIAVSDELDDTLTLLGAGGDRRLRTARQPGGVAAAGGRLVAVVAVSDRVLELFDVVSGEREGRIDAGVGPTHLVADPARRRLYVADTQGDAILAVDTAPELRINDRLALPGAPYGLALDPARGRLWVTLTGRNSLAELELGQRAPRLVRTLPTVRQPNSVAVDTASGRVFVASRSDGVLQLIDP